MADEETKEDLPAEAGDDTELVEFEYNEDGEEDLKKTLKKLRADLKACQKEKTEYLTGWQRAKADYVNLDKELKSSAAKFMDLGKEGMIEDILPALESFDMAFANKEAWAKVDDNWRKGVEYIHSTLLSALENNGLSEISAAGVAFEPLLHQAVENVETDDKSKDHTIAKIIQKGYKLGDRVLRPAKVAVFEYK